MIRLRCLLAFLANPHFLLCFGIAWMLTNGWAYALFALGTVFSNPFLLGIAGGYLALLWLPFTPEKIITVFIAVRLLKRFFPEDQRTLKELLDFTANA